MTYRTYSSKNRFSLTKNIEQTYPHDVYVLDDIMFLPHYTKNVFVAPGHDLTHKSYTEDELVAMGAQKKQEMLWQRVRNRK